MGQGGSSDAPINPRDKEHAKIERTLSKRRALRILDASILGRRVTQEDRHVVMESLPNHPHISYFAVFDGHNGDACAAYCAEYLHFGIAAKIPRGGHISPQGMRDAFVQMDDAFCSTAAPPENDSGCTAVVAVYNRITNQLTVANCGDARCVLNKAGKAQDMSIDHKPDVPEEKERIEHAGRRVIDSRLDGVLAVSRALGDFGLKAQYYKTLAHGKNKRVHAEPERWALTPVPQVFETVITRDHGFMVLACDGLFDVMNNQEVVDWLCARLKMEEDDQLELALATSPSNLSAASGTASGGAGVHSPAPSGQFLSVPPSVVAQAQQQQQQPDQAEEDSNDRPPVSATDVGSAVRADSESSANAMSSNGADSRVVHRQPRGHVTSELAGSSDDDNGDEPEESPEEAYARRAAERGRGRGREIEPDQTEADGDASGDPTGAGADAESKDDAAANGSEAEGDDEPVIAPENDHRTEEEKARDAAERKQKRQERQAARAAAARAVQATLSTAYSKRKKKTEQQLKADELERRRVKLQTLSTRPNQLRDDDELEQMDADKSKEQKRKALDKMMLKGGGKKKKDRSAPSDGAVGAGAGAAALSGAHLRAVSGDANNHSGIGAVPKQANMAEDLAEYAVKKGSTDNVSVVIICLEKRKVRRPPDQASLGSGDMIAAVAGPNPEAQQGLGNTAAILLGGNLSPRAKPVVGVAPLSPRGVQRQ